MQKKSLKNDSNLEILEKILILISFFVYVIAFQPFLKNFVIAGHDIAAHLTYLRVFTDALYQGQFPVRWIEWSTPGLNLPLFSYYPSIFYYLTQIPHLFKADLLISSNLTLLFLWVFSGFFVYLLVKNITKITLAAVASAAIYVFSPYHILDVFVRSAYPEITALFFIPGVFWASERLFETAEKKYISFLAFFFAATYLSHPPTIIMFSFPILLFSSYLLYKKYKEEVKSLSKIYFEFISGIILGIGLSGYFTLPQILQQNLINFQHLNTGYSDFHSHFVCLLQLIIPNWGYGISVQGCSDQLSFQIGIVNWIVILATIFILIFLFVKKIKHKSTSLTYFFLTIGFFGAYMCLSYSLPFWEGLPYISVIQFPWRFLSVVIFSVAVLTGLIFTYINNLKLRFFVFALIMTILPLSVFSYISSSNYLPKDYFHQDSSDFYKFVNNLATPEVAFMPIFAKVLPDPAYVPLSGIEDPSAKIKVIKNEFTYKEYLLSSSKKSQALVYVHYFPGWKYDVNGKNVKVSFSNIYGFSVISLDSGQNRVIAKLENTNIINFANLISLLSLIIVITIILASFKKNLVKRFKRI